MSMVWHIYTVASYCVVDVWHNLNENFDMEYVVYG